MSETAYKVLYRKYRPSTFDGVISQKSVTDTLKSSVKNGTFSHAYVFTGPRGTGKTSTAKIMAKAINCEKTNDGEPCGKCQSCLNFNTSPDIIEIDAASNNGVDEIRELRNNVALAPGLSKYKIYIIDEVHMLSTGAFNALLKTLEEPPSHAIFILATTEVYKIPITILSRCQRYDFKKIAKTDMIMHLKDICNKENIDCDEASLEEIYELSEGCLRDALSILDQMSKLNKSIKVSDILEKYNIVSDKTIDSILSAVKDGNVDAIVSTIKQFQDSGMNPQKLIKKMLAYIEKIYVELKLSTKKDYSPSMLEKLLKNLNECYVEARINDNIYTMIILAFLELIDNHGKINNEKKLDNRAISLIDIRINNCFVDANKNDLQELIKNWNTISKGKPEDLDISDYKPVAASSSYAIFTSEDESLVNLFNVKCEDVEKFLKKNKITLKVVALTENRWNSEKEKYKVNVKKGNVYKHIDEPEKKKIDDTIIKEIFDDKIIEVS